MLKLLRRTRPRTRVGAGIVVALLIAGSVYWFGVRDASASAATPAAATTRSVAASLTTLEKSVTATGTLAPTVNEDVSFAASGAVTAIPVAVGQTVTVGQTLATIDTLTLDANLLSAKATLASAAAKLSNSKDDSDGTAAATAQIAANAAQVKVAQVAVDSATAAMADATLTAPVAGLLTEINLTVGDRVTGTSSSSSSSSSSSQGATGATGSTGSSSSASTTSSAQFVIVGTDSWTIDVTVDDADLALIAVADQAEITLDGADAPIFGTVASLGLISTTTSGVAGYPVVIAVTGAPAGLHDGVSADVVIVYERRAEVLTVPSGAVRTVNGTSTVTQKGADGKEVQTPVTIGDTVGQLTEIVSGIAEGDEVLVTVVTTSTQSTTRQGSTGETGMPPGDFTFPEGFVPGQMPGGRSNG